MQKTLWETRKKPPFSGRVTVYTLFRKRDTSRTTPARTPPARAPDAPDGLGAARGRTRESGDEMPTSALLATLYG